MWPIPQFPADLVTFTESLMENFIFCIVITLIEKKEEQKKIKRKR